MSILLPTHTASSGPHLAAAVPSSTFNIGTSDVHPGESVKIPIQIAGGFAFATQQSSSVRSNLGEKKGLSLQHYIHICTQQSTG